MTGVALISPRRKYTDAAGNPIAGGSVTIYYAGTTSLAATYQDRALSIANTNPITLDANGECLVWVDDTFSYKELVKDANGTTFSGYPVDNIRGAGAAVSGVSDITVDRFSGTGAQTAFTLSTTPANGENATEVYVNGAYIQKNAYSVAGNVLTFAVAPASGSNNIEVNTFGYTDYIAAATAVAASASAAAASASSAADSAADAAASESNAADSAEEAADSAAAAALSEAQAAAIVLGNFLQNGAGAQARTFTGKARDTICILDFIPQTEHAGIKARTNSTYKCDTALTNALASVASDQACAIYFPAGRYYFQNTINIKKKVMFYGDGGSGKGDDFWDPTDFWFPANKVGIFVHRFDTTADNTGTPAIESPATKGGDGSVFRNIVVTRDFNDATAHSNAGKPGWWIKARVTMECCGAYNFDGDGLIISATSGTAADFRGNANCFTITSFTAWFNQGNGITVSGSDANAGVVTMADCSQNQGYGIRENSFLGNTYIACHTAANVLAGYRATTATGQNVFVGCYAESGQPANELASGTLVLGGFMVPGSGVLAGQLGNALTPSSGGLYNRMDLGTWPDPSIQRRAAFSNAMNSTGLMMFLSARDLFASGDLNWILDSTNKCLQFKYTTGSGGIYYQVTADATLHQLGTGASAPNMMILGPQVALSVWNDFQNGRRIGMATTQPASGLHGRGEVMFATAPVAGGKVGWTCVTTGTPGTWQTFGKVDGGGGQVTQNTSKATGVTLNTVRGEITMNAANLAANTRVQFTLTNSQVGANDTVVVHRKSGGTAGAYMVGVDSIAAGSAVIWIKNDTGGALAEAPLLQFEVLSGAIA